MLNKISLYIIFGLVFVFASFTTYESVYRLTNNSSTYAIGETTIIGKSNISTYFTVYLSQTNNFLFSNSLPLSITSWISIGALVWRGKIKKVILENGFDYDLFFTMLKMKGSITRLSILNSLTYPKNRKQIAETLEIDWKAVDRHVSVLLKHQLINEMTQVGNSMFYIRNEKGNKLLEVLNKNGFHDKDSS